MADNLPAPIIFCDVETTGLGPDDEIWEIAAVRRAPDGSQVELHRFVEHDEKKCRRLPDAFREDHDARFPAYCSNRVFTRSQAAGEIVDFFGGLPGTPKPVVVGINPAFDVGHISRLISTYRPGSDATPWNYTPVDARHLAVGALMAYPIKVMRGAPTGHPTIGGGFMWQIDEQMTFGNRFSGPPWGSEDVSRALGIDPDDFARHTAMGDVLWAMAIYDAATNTAPLDGAKGTTTP